MKTLIRQLSLSMAVAFGIAAPAAAAPITFFGQDQGVFDQAGNLIGTRPNSTQAEANFLALLSGVGTESFESFTDGVISPLGLTFPGAGTATLLGGGSVDDDPGTGQAAVDGTKWWRTGLGNDFSITFSQPIAAFGFYGIDVGDINSQLTLTLVGGGIVNIPIPHSLGGAMNGSLIYFGYIDTANLFTSATFTNAGAGDDFGFDRMTIGSAQQVQPVPEPGTLLLLGGGLAAVFAAAKKARTRS